MSDNPKTSTTIISESTYSEVIDNTRPVDLNVEFCGDPGPGDFLFMAIFNGQTILDGLWADGAQFGTNKLPLDLNNFNSQALVASTPIIFILRAIGGKPTKQDPDPLLNTENRAGGTIDLLPLVLGEEEIFTTVHLVSVENGDFFGCQIIARARSPGMSEHPPIPLVITMISAHCMPLAKDGTVYISAIGLNNLHEPIPLDLGTSLSNPDAKKLVWSKVNRAGYAANTAYNASDKDIFVPPNLELKNTEECRSFYWNTVNRVLVQPDKLQDRLSEPFLIEVAGVPKIGKPEVRGRYMGWADARALLEPAQFYVSVSVELSLYNEFATEGIRALLVLPPSSAKTTARDSDLLYDEHGHNAYAVVRFDIVDPLVDTCKIMTLYETIGFSPPERICNKPIEKFDTHHVPSEPVIDAKFIKKDGGALAVHKELQGLATVGTMPLTQGIKRTAANRLLMRVRTMLKNFPPGGCTHIYWQDTITGQHNSSRRAVTASFAPQAPPTPLPRTEAAARCRAAGDLRLAEKHIKTNLQVAGSHPKSLICKAIRCLEVRNDLDAKNYLFEALNRHPRNIYLLWMLGAQEFNKGKEGAELAIAAFLITTKGDLSAGTANTIAWAALHSCYHYIGNIYAAHVAAKKMRKFFSYPKTWGKFLKRWMNNSGEEEIHWSPDSICSDNPMLLAAAFFLCLRCYKFCENILNCVSANCATRGSLNLHCQQGPDIYYLTAAAFILKRQYDDAMETIKTGTANFGPNALLSQLHVACLAHIREWDEECEKAFIVAENCGAEESSSVLYKSALSRFKTHPYSSLQRVAILQQTAPSGHTALLIGRIYEVLGDYERAERWCAISTRLEPYLSDGWAMLAILAMYERKLDKARSLLRTAKQVGPISPDICEDVKKFIGVVDLDQLPDNIVKSSYLKNEFACCRL